MPAISNPANLINCEAIVNERLLLPVCRDKQVTVDVLRLDLAHPVISGNKFFKLKVAIGAALKEGATGIVSFGGAYSNHIVALAYTCSRLGLKCIGIIRGEAPPELSPALCEAISFGMQPIYVSRHDYRNKEALTEHYLRLYPGYQVIPEGGQSAMGVAGAAEIASLTNYAAYNCIACAVGTGTTIAGLAKVALPSQKVHGFSALKFSPELQIPGANSMETFIRQHAIEDRFVIHYNYHFGGYAKKTLALTEFMNKLWDDHKLPTDFVYTAKMFYGLADLIGKDCFAPGTRLLAIHSGGLQGNRSISDQLIF